MTDPRAKYEQALAAFATPGGRWAHKGALTYWGKAAGLTADDLIADARAHGVNDRDADIRKGWNDARPKFVNGKPTADYTPRSKPQPPPPAHTHHVRNMLAGLDAASGTADWVRELSPCLDWLGNPPTLQTELFMRAAFTPDERVFIFRDDPPTVGTPWVNLRPAADWLERLGLEPLTGDHVVPNPFTGKQGETTDGKPSFVAQSCLAAFPFLIVEFDAMPLPTQYAFWRAFILTSKLAPALLAVVFSGNKSLHGLVHVGCRTLLDWQAVRNRFAELFASDADSTYRADVQAMRPRTGTRLPGVKRFDNGALQELVYLNPRARAGTMWRDAVPMPPPADDLAAHCAACDVLNDCRRAFGRYWADRSRGGVGCTHPFHGWRRDNARVVDLTAVVAQKELFR